MIPIFAPMTVIDKSVTPTRERQHINIAHISRIMPQADGYSQLVHFDGSTLTVAHNERELAHIIGGGINTHPLAQIFRHLVAITSAPQPGASLLVPDGVTLKR